MCADLLTLESETQTGNALLQPVMRGGKRVARLQSLEQARTRARDELARLPEALRGLTPAQPYPVQVSDSLHKLAEEVDHAQASAT